MQLKRLGVPDSSVRRWLVAPGGNELTLPVVEGNVPYGSDYEL